MFKSFHEYFKSIFFSLIQFENRVTHDSIRNNFLHSQLESEKQNSKEIKKSIKSTVFSMTSKKQKSPLKNYGKPLASNEIRHCLKWKLTMWVCLHEFNTCKIFDCQSKSTRKKLFWNDFENSSFFYFENFHEKYVFHEKIRWKLILENNKK